MPITNEAIEHYYRASQGITYSGKKLKEARKRLLPTLSEMVDAIDIFSTVDLGIREIRLDRIEGTYYDSRNSVFMDQFIPRAHERSEFYSKWVNLCDAQMTEGIRDPILVYEYLNRYYVQEGNKRVSVLKYFEAVTVSAKVIRLIPPYDDKNQEIINYYSFLDFFNKTNYEDIWFTKHERFQEMITLMDACKKKESYKDYLRGHYARFRRTYKNHLEDKFPEAANKLTTGDLYLTYCNLFSEAELDEASLRKRMGEVIKSCLSDNSVEVVDAVEEAFKSKPMMTWFGKPKVAFVFPHSADSNGWSKDHLRSQEEMKKQYKGQMTVDIVENVLNNKSPMSVLEEAAKKYDVLFLINSSLSEIANQCAVDYPNTTFLLCTGIKTSYLLPSYFGKTYQTNFLLGMYSALVACEDHVGYVSKDMNPTIYRSMRAFEEGYKSIRPTAVIHYAKDKATLAESINYAAFYRTLVDAHLTEGTVNTYFKEIKGTLNIAYTYWEWQRFYEGIFQRLADGSFAKLRNAHKASSNALFFLWGMDTEVIGIKTNETLASPSSQHIFESIKEDIIEGRFDLTHLRDSDDYEAWCNIYR